VRSALAALRFPADAPFDVVAVTAEQLQARAPHELQKPETMNYRTMAPEPGGLFDPKLFGPGTVIDAAVPEGDAMIRPRKTWFARLPLAAPMVHPLLIQYARQELVDLSGRTASEVWAATARFEANRALVAALEAEHGWTIVRELAVLPPDLRPLKLDEHMRWVVTPLNGWYQRIVSRNARLKKQLDQGTLPDELDTDWAELHELWRGLAENDETAQLPDADGEPLPSLRALAGGTEALYATLKDIAAQPAAALAESATAEPVPAREYIARAVLFALGFELASAHVR